jgi:hypothetical protein
MTFEGENHADLVRQVQEWLATVETEEEGPLTPAEAIEQGADLTKDALRIIAQAAPGRIAQNDVFQRLTGMGYKATDATKAALITGVGAIEDATGGGVVKEIRDTGRDAIYEMNVAVAKQILKQLQGS